MKKQTEIDGRTKPARRHNAIVSDIRRLVGDRHPVEVVEPIAQQFATLVIMQEKLTARLLEGRGSDGGSFVRLVNCSTRCLRHLGLIPADENGDDMADGEDLLERYVAKKAKHNGTKRDRRRARLVT